MMESKDVPQTNTAKTAAAKIAFIFPGQGSQAVGMAKS